MSAKSYTTHASGQPHALPHVIILGTGIGGLSTALKLASGGQVQVTLICKAEMAEGSTRYAQGGIASVWSREDTVEEHERDTLRAGAGLCHDDIVELTVREGPSRVQELIEMGVPFTRAEEPAGSPEIYDLHREGGHGQRRILHAADLTGWAIEKTLIDQVARYPNIRVLERHIGVDLITEGKLFGRWRRPGRCLGAYLLDIERGQVVTLAADVTVLATGGAGKVYLYTSNPDTTTGDGIAMAYRAGARVANLEFMQFHPTCLYHPGTRTFLISEAVRGEGAVLRNLAGEEFMSAKHPMGSLAPRDIVARGIDEEMKRTGDRHVWLDCSNLSVEEFARKFPHILDTCRSHGIHPPRQPIPVVPACHYTCGGVQTDADARTSVEGLYAVGEVACTGLHGANRLASNSLLEAVVFATRLACHALPRLLARGAPGAQDRPEPATLPGWDSGRAVRLEERIDIASSWLEIRSLMWNYVGIVRSDRRLERARQRLELLKSEINDDYWRFLLTQELVELRNLHTVAELIVQCALMRKESRGLHFTVDHPERDDVNFGRDTVL